jgi:hypothetical protein
MNRTLFRTAIALLAIALTHQPAADLSAQSSETYTAKATPGNQTENADSITITFVINRYTTEAENTALRNTLKGGSAALRAALKSSPELGSISSGSKRAALKYAYKRPNSQSITMLTDEPVAYLDPGNATNKPKEGYDLALAILDFSAPGFAIGELDPAVKVTMNPAGSIITEDYGAAVVRLTSVTKK